MRTTAAVTALTLALTGCQSGSTASPSPAASSPAAAATDNGVAALEADAILAKAKAALASAKSFQAKGRTNLQGQDTDVDLKVSGADFSAVMSFDKVKVELIAAGEGKFLRPNEEFLAMAAGAEQGKLMAQSINGRWISAGGAGGEAFAQIFTIGTVDEFLAPDGTLTKGEQKEIDGKPAIGLKDAGDTGTVLWIATTGEPLPLQITGKDGDAVVFSDFGATFSDIVAPPADQIYVLGS
ncbi:MULTISPECIES: hypothetical protein [Actinoplanes]|uniref:hypothetical protein n=1 Tax=Actinoplanes TaxID=1865 RepID=UPI0005F2C82E|nr:MULTISPECIES: hypothetical protein [Actinoplanes]GLY04341.1 hypothetical protein Acsp01_47200 [Actinoplanes sp. NBRC 101535]